jgi:glucose/mannose transport system substrate-binding protein
MKPKGTCMTSLMALRQTLHCGLLSVWVWGFSSTAQAQPLPLDVLHWWTSAGEQLAVDQLKAHLLVNGVRWKDAAIPGGGGMAAVKVLKSRVLMGDPPDVAQLIGATLTDWTDVGLVMPLNHVANRQRWSQSMFPTVIKLVTYKGVVIAAPLGIHRINTLIYNRHVFTRLGLQPPTTWEEFELLAYKLRAQGVKPLAWSDEAWQIATVFESILLGEVGPEQYRELIVRRKSPAWREPGVEKALTRLRWLRNLSGDTPRELAWTDATLAVLEESAAMVIMGDWAKGELMAWGASPERDFGCAAVPGTHKMHLYSVDTLAMLWNSQKRTSAQEKLAELVASPNIQLAYNRVKGSVPVRTDVDTANLDSCARDSWTTFATSGNALVPSLAHRMAADEATKDAVAQVLWRFLISPPMSAKEAQRRLALAVRAP